jgi:arylsulfatase A-like enzyme
VSVAGAGLVLLLFGALPKVAPASAGNAAAGLPDVLLVTIDTLRADLPGCYGGEAKTPRLDALAASGVRFTHALTPVPLTLPAHASLLTGLDPNQHGLRDNGQGVLAPAIPTVAEAFRSAGYATLAVVGSRVLDRRFGLARGFELYDDRMAAERTGEFGYPERPAAAVVAAALAAAEAVSAARPLFLWVHFYDAHAPYDGAGSDPRSRYRSEVEAIDRELGRLLDGLRPGPARRPRIVAVVGDHGESFGEHGESEHGYLLHTPTLAVPLLLAGPGVPPAGTRTEPASIRRLAATLVRLAGLDSEAARRLGGPAFDLAGGVPSHPEAVYHETEFPASTFGWSPLAALTASNWRFVSGPRPALYDLAADPGEQVDRLREEPERARALRKELARLTARVRLAPPAEAPHDEELRRQLESLGYLSGASSRRGTLDPAEGVLLLGDFADAKRRLAAGDTAGAQQLLRRLVGRSPQSVPFLSQLAEAEEGLGNLEAARSALLAAIAVNPQSEFLHASLGKLELRSGRPVEGERALREALALQPRFLPATLALGELLVRSGRAAEEEALVRAAVAAGAESGVLLTRLGEIELRRGEIAAADLHLAEATRVLPEFPTAWRLWAEVARRQNDPEAAAARAARAAALQ